GVVVESITLGKRVEFRLSLGATIAYAVQVIADHFQFKDQVPTAPGRVVRVRTVLVHAAAEAEGAQLSASAQASVAACGWADGRLVMIASSVASTKTLADLGVQDGDVFHLYQLIDSRPLEAAYLDVDLPDLLKRRPADRSPGADPAEGQ